MLPTLEVLPRKFFPKGKNTAIIYGAGKQTTACNTSSLFICPCYKFEVLDLVDFDLRRFMGSRAYLNASEHRDESIDSALCSLDY